MIFPYEEVYMVLTSENLIIWKGGNGHAWMKLLFGILVTWQCGLRGNFNLPFLVNLFTWATPQVFAHKALVERKHDDYIYAIVARMLLYVSSST